MRLEKEVGDLKKNIADNGEILKMLKSKFEMIRIADIKTETKQP
jgi:hypothetical protein